MFSIFQKSSQVVNKLISSHTVKPFAPNFRLIIANEFHRKLTRTTKCGYNTHRSNRAKRGLYHGKDVHSGHSISHSKQKTKRKFYPNAIKKRVWSYALNDWVRFNMTTTALKKIDDYGGVDNYVLNLDERSVQESNYIIKMRGLIAGALFNKGTLSDRMTRQLKFDVTPPTPSFTGLDSTFFHKRKKRLNQRVVENYNNRKRKEAADKLHRAQENAIKKQMMKAQS